MGNLRSVEAAGGARELLRFLLVLRHLQRARAVILNRAMRVGGHASDKAVVLTQAARREAEERLRMSLDVRSQDAGRCACRSLARAARIDDADVGAARRQLVGRSTADDP